MSNRILASELLLPYALVCAVDNSCSGLSTHPGGAMQEYLEHKKTIAGVTNAVVSMLATVSRHDIAGIWVAFFSRCQRYCCRQVPDGYGTATGYTNMGTQLGRQASANPESTRSSKL